MDAEKLVRQILDVLSSTSDAKESSVAIALDYATLCREVNVRLAQCAAMLEKGSQYQAIQLAESEPVLLDLVNAVSFTESQQWREFCKTNQLPIADKLDIKSIKAVNALYAKGISANHPLYKDYRAAVTSRKDDEALRIIKMIVRLNPTDANAKSELVRLENKLFQEKLRDLRQSLEMEDTPGVLKILNQLEGIGQPIKLSENSDYKRGIAKRKEILRNGAINDSHKYVTELSEYGGNDDWQRVGEVVARIRASQTQHDFDLYKGDEQVVAQMESYYQTKRTEAIQSARYEECVSALKQQIGHAEHALLDRGGLKLQSTRNEFNELNRRYREAELFGKKVSEEIQNRVRRVVATLKAELGRLEKQRRIRIGLASAVAIALVAATTWFVYDALQARDFSEQINRLMQTKQVAPTAKLVSDIQSMHRRIADKPVLRAKIAEAENWIKTERTKREAVDRAVLEVESIAGKDFADSVPLNVHKQLQTLSADISNLAVDLKPEPEAKLATVRNKFDLKVASLRSANQKAMEELLRSLESATGAQLSFDKSPPELMESLRRLEPDLKRLAEFAEPGVEELNPPAALLARANAITTRVETIQKELAKLDHIAEELQNATSLEAYQHALEGFRDSLFAHSELVKRARMMILSFPKADDILAKLLVPDDASAWTAAKNDKSDGSLVPSDVFPAELSKLLALRDDDNLRDIWEATYVDHQRSNASHTIYSRGEIKQPTDSFVAYRTVRTWTGLFYDAAKNSEAAQFANLTYTAEIYPSGERYYNELTKIRRSSTSAALGSLYLQDLIDDKGTKFQKSIFSVLDSLVKPNEANPIFKGYAMQQLGDLIKLRPFAWGLQWCPSARKDFEVLERLCGDYRIKSEDWMIPKRNSEWVGKLGSFFNGISKRSYLLQARANCDLVRNANRVGLSFVGYADANGKLHLVADAAAAKEIWSLARDSDIPVRITSHTANNGEVVYDDTNVVAPFSPLFLIRVDRNKMLTELSKKMGVNLDDASIRDELPPYFRPTVH